jgi:hypothetical protein
MKLLVSIAKPSEVCIALRGGADIIDVKNPDEGSLGANFPWVIAEAKKIAKGSTLSAAIGDFDFRPGTASLAALGAATAGAEYVKVGLKFDGTERAKEFLEHVSRAVKSVRGKKVVAAAYADHERLGTISPFELLDVALDAGVDVVMVDTGLKDGQTTFEFMSDGELTDFVSGAREAGMKTALAGCLGIEHLPRIKKIAPDIVGVRSCVCGGSRNADVKEELVKEFRRKLDEKKRD